MRLDAYLSDRAGNGPSGENLEYDPAFTALILAAQPGEERQAGNEIIAAEEPDFRQVTERALAVLERSHDLRAAVMLGYAQLRLNGLEGLAGAVAYVRHCLENHWDTCHPQLDAEDDNDPTMRINAVLGLAEPARMLRALRLAPLTHSASFGRFCLRDIAVADGELAAPEDMTTVPDAAAIRAAFKDTRPDVLRARLEAARSLLEDSTAINAVFDARTPGEGPDMDPLIRMAKKAVGRLAEAVGEPAEAATEASAGPPATESAAAAVPGSISSRRDIEDALDRIMAYYAANEPSSPLPIILARARRLVGADFMTIMTDLAPLGIENVKLVGGIAEEDQY
ncbi:type VI secretion system protein TssA [Paracoccaceae bacterium Fryx2]|nr:type VI secretion system protein TssA [Paracoccaceae bacterium Fryx2]